MSALAALDPAGPNARAAADLWWLMLALGTATFVLVFVLGVIALRRRNRPDDEVVDGREDVGGRWIMLGGIALPAVVVGVVLVATLSTMADAQYEAPADAVGIDVVSFQYGWTAAHGDADGTELDNELVIPVGRPVALTLTSRDVIHSFWVPQLAGKMDALPDGETTLVIEADEPGEYLGRCAEFCGLLHAEMPLTVVALADGEYDRWRADPGSVVAGDPGQTDTEGDVSDDLIEEDIEIRESGSEKVNEPGSPQADEEDA